MSKLIKEESDIQKAMKNMSKDSMFGDQPSVTVTTGSKNALPIGYYEQKNMCEKCALSLLEDLQAGMFELNEAEHGGKKVQLGKVRRTPGGPKKFSVYVKNNKGNVVKVNFGDPGLSIKRDNPTRRKAYRARHHCDNPGPRWKSNYWSCRNWSTKPVSKITK